MLRYTWLDRPSRAWRLPVSWPSCSLLCPLRITSVVGSHKTHLSQLHLLSVLLDLLNDEPEDRFVSVDELTGISQFSHEHRDRLFGRVVVCHDLEQFPCSHFVESHARIKRRAGTDLAPEIKATLNLLGAHDAPPPLGFIVFKYCFTLCKPRYAEGDHGDRFKP